MSETTYFQPCDRPPKGWYCNLPADHDGPCPTHHTRIEIHCPHSHWRWDKPHHPRRCLICWAEKIYVRLGLAHYEWDMDDDYRADV